MFIFLLERSHFYRVRCLCLGNSKDWIAFKEPWWRTRIKIKISFESLTFCHQYTQTSLSDIAEIKSKLTSMKRVFPIVQLKLPHFYSFKIGVTSLKRVFLLQVGTLAPWWTENCFDSQSDHLISAANQTLTDHSLKVWVKHHNLYMIYLIQYQYQTVSVSYSISIKHHNLYMIDLIQYQWILFARVTPTSK